MIVNHSFDPEFTKLMDNLKAELPEALFRLEGIHDEQLDINSATKKFFKLGDNPTADASIDANANVSGKDTITYCYELSKPISKLNSLYNLWKNIKEEHGLGHANSIMKAEIIGTIYINDAYDIGRPYCFNYSMYDIALEGLKMSNRLKIDPPKSLASFLRQVEQFTVYAANSTLGATGLADLLIVAAGYYQRILKTGKDNHVSVTFPSSYAKELITSLIYTLNWEFRGNQSPFTNVSVYDDVFLKKLVPSYIVLGEEVSITNVKVMQNIYLECMNDILDRTPITFPVTTACFAVEENDGERKIQDKNFLETISQYNLKNGFINIYMGKSSTLSSCCRLRSESDGDGLGYTNSFGSGSTKIGSLGVVTINLPQLAYLAITDCENFDDAFEDFLKMVKADTIIASIVNRAKRKFIEDRISRGALPLYDLGYMSLSRQYCTCGFTGLYEALEILGYDIKDEVGLHVAEKVLSEIRKTNERLTKETGIPHNCEQTPSENSAVKLAKKDQILGINEDYDLYSNQFVPLIEGAWLGDRLVIQGCLDPLCDGGSILHINTAQPFKVAQDMANLIETACKYGIVYFAINLVLLQCENKHVFVSDKGSFYKGLCPKCGGQVTDEWTRVVGFLTNTKHWNETRRKVDYPQRKFYLKGAFNG